MAKTAPKVATRRKFNDKWYRLDGRKKPINKTTAQKRQKDLKEKRGFKSVRILKVKGGYRVYKRKTA